MLLIVYLLCNCTMGQWPKNTNKDYYYIKLEKSCPPHGHIPARSSLFRMETYL